MKKYEAPEAIVIEFSAEEEIMYGGIQTTISLIGQRSFEHELESQT